MLRLSTKYIILLLTQLLFIVVKGNETNETAEDDDSIVHGDLQGDEAVTVEGEEHEEEEEPAFAVLFPSFALTVGVVVFYVLSRHIKALPYTAVMFLIGTLMGITSAVSDYTNHISQTLDAWISINSEVLLLVFLPGLIFKDAFGQNVHLFLYSLIQLLIFAFPMVLGGTVVGALIGYFIFPFGWSFNFAMTVGSILAATDPVAVAALLEEVGAPPRLKVHVAGEALLNDGSAIVFFSIFSERYFNEFGIHGFGDEIDLRLGISMFCQKALGGTAAGLFFGLVLLGVLFVLNRRFSREENVVQVTAIVAVAYLNYYVSDFVWKTSGVIATVAAGVTVKFIGRAMVNDLKLLEDFLTLVEHILNTILFTLGGIVWGAVIATGEREGIWGAREWGYLILLFILMNALRALQFVLAYPITVRIGLKTNWQETAFQIFGGLRGAVGIALAIALDNEVALVTGGNDETTEERHTQQAFAMIGGMAFLTLVINGTTAGPFLRKLGLANSTEARQRIVRAYGFRLRAAMIDNMVKLLCQNRFRHVNFAFVKFHVPQLADLTKTQLLQAVEKHKTTVPSEEYAPPHLARVLPYVADDTGLVTHEGAREVEQQLKMDHEKQERNARIAQRVKNRKAKRRTGCSTSNLRYMMESEPFSSQELRILFLSILRAAYEKQIEEGELDDAHILAISLDQSLEFALDAVTKGGPLNDWEYLVLMHKPFLEVSRRVKESSLARTLLKLSATKKRDGFGLKGRTTNMLIERSLNFMAAHRTAQAAFISELQDADSELTEAAKVVMEESNKQYILAEQELKNFDLHTTELAISHKFCKILLTSGIHYIDKLVTIGLLKESEAEEFVEGIEENLHHVVTCDMKHHPGEIMDESEGSDDEVIYEGVETVSSSRDAILNTDEQ